LKNPSVSSSLFEVWNAYNYLIKTPVNSWQIDEAVKHLALIKENLNPDYSFKDTLHEKISESIENFFERDEASGYSLLDWLRENGCIDENDVCDLIVRIFINKLKTGSSGLKASWEAIKKQPFAVMAAGKLLEKSILDSQNEIISKSDGNRADQILSVYIDCLKIVQRSSPIEKDEIKRATFLRGIALEDMELLKVLLKEFGGNTDRAENFIFSIAKKIEGDSKKSDFFWRFILDVFAASVSETRIRSFCKTVIEQNFPERVEDILTKGLISGIKPGVLCEIFRETYKDPGKKGGRKFFERYIEKAENIKSYFLIIDEIIASKLHERTRASLYPMIDKKLPLIVKRQSSEAELERKLRKTAGKDVECSNATAGLLLCDLEYYLGKTDLVSKLLQEYLKYKVTINADFTRTEYCNILFDRIIPSLELVSQHIAILCIFGCPDLVFNFYIDNIALRAKKKPGILIRLLAISRNNYPAPEKPMLETLESVYGKEKLSVIKNRIVKEIPVIIEKNYSEKLVALLRDVAAKYKNKELSGELEKYLAQAKAKYEVKRQNRPLGLFKQLFKPKGK
jgi:hypothetical protein